MIGRLALAVVVLTTALGSPALATTRGNTAVVCASAPAPVTAAQAERVWSIALGRLAARSDRPTLPFGATGSSRYVRTAPSSWTSGFFPASLWLMYEHTGDPAWLTQAREYTDRVTPMARLRTTHDLGFMVGLPAGLGAALDPDPTRRTDYLHARDTAAGSLSTRWNRHVGALQSATYSGRWGLIIDSAMNAPLLIETGLPASTHRERRLLARGVQHIRTLARTFVRANGSTAHRQAFDGRTGRLVGPIPGQGLRGSSTWSRGQAWAINGFARTYALTGDTAVLDTARRTADHWIARVPAGCVPAWDLDISDPREPLDSSAAAIAADGLLQLADHDPDPSRSAAYRSYALATLGTLASAPFVTDRGRGILLRQSYSAPLDHREGTYVWGDTFLLSALSRAFPTSGAQASITSVTS